MVFEAGAAAALFILVVARCFSVPSGRGVPDCPDPDVPVTTVALSVLSHPAAVPSPPVCMSGSWFALPPRLEHRHRKKI